MRPVTGWVDLDVLMEPSDQALAYALTFVRAEKETAARLHVSSDEGLRAWVNGREVR